MEWTIRFMYAVGLTTVTGTLVTLVWYLIGRILEKAGFLNIVYRFMRMAMLFWLVPVVYGILSFLEDESCYGNGYLFGETPVILAVSKVFCFIWIAGSLVSLLCYLTNLFHLHHQLGEVIQCDYAVTELFETICDEYHVRRGRVAIGCSYREQVPKIARIIHPMIVLPVKEYSGEELEVIIRHELMHAKQRDVLMKNLGMIVRSLHFMNPFVWWYLRLLNKWSEFACDYEVCLREQNLRTYYSMVAGMAQECGHTAMLFSQLIERKSAIRERMEHVTRCYRKENKSKMKAAMIVGGMVLASGTTVYGVTVSCAEMSVGWYDVTNQLEEEDVRPAVLEESVKNDDLSEPQVREGQVGVATESGITRFEWEVSGHLQMQSPGFEAKAGQRISVNVFTTPSHTDVRIGIVEPDQILRYVSMESGAIHEFEVMQDGFYRIIVENESSTDMTADGFYMVR